mmetsp:Transcript_78183/g.232869  ORF Transcript_78183/g.232869 Transcript_78183/m.232869 type:complete len:311 (+) Transcript_78183:343-1275(+)
MGCSPHPRRKGPRQISSCRRWEVRTRRPPGSSSRSSCETLHAHLWARTCWGTQPTPFRWSSRLITAQCWPRSPILLGHQDRLVLQLQRLGSDFPLHRQVRRGYPLQGAQAAARATRGLRQVVAGELRRAAEHKRDLQPDRLQLGLRAWRLGPMGGRSLHRQLWRRPGGAEAADHSGAQRQREAMPPLVQGRGARAVRVLQRQGLRAAVSAIDPERLREQIVLGGNALLPAMQRRRAQLHVAGTAEGHRDARCQMRLGPQLPVQHGDVQDPEPLPWEARLAAVGGRLVRPERCLPPLRPRGRVGAAPPERV